MSVLRINPAWDLNAARLLRTILKKFTSDFTSDFQIVRQQAILQAIFDERF